jgi:hypothetical protein
LLQTGLGRLAGAAHEASLRATLGRWSLARRPCAARAGRGLAKLGCASNNASPDPPAAALLGTAQGWHGAMPHAFGKGSTKWLLLILVSTNGNRFLDDWGDRFFSYSALHTVFGLQPNEKLLLTFARIASTTAKGNIFSCNYRFFIDDVFPARRCLFRDFGGRECSTAIDAGFISGTHFTFEPGRDIPVVCHVDSSEIVH